MKRITRDIIKLQTSQAPLRARIKIGMMNPTKPDFIY